MNRRSTESATKALLETAITLQKTALPNRQAADRASVADRTGERRARNADVLCCEFAHPQQRLEALDMSVYRVEVEIRERGVSL